MGYKKMGRAKMHAVHASFYHLIIVVLSREAVRLMAVSIRMAS
jgi:hypothetical protein